MIPWQVFPLVRLLLLDSLQKRITFQDFHFVRFSFGDFSHRVDTETFFATSTVRLHDYRIHAILRAVGTVPQPSSSDVYTAAFPLASSTLLASLKSLNYD